jgi:ABC-type polysaccharide/polyol phosphate export permease
MGAPLVEDVVVTRPILITGAKPGKRHAAPRKVGYIRAGWTELLEGVQVWRIWYLIGAGELRRRYARSRLGQLWLTVSSGISIAIIGVMWSVLWKAPIGEMLPFLATSMVIWQFLSGIIGEATTVFSANAHYLLTQRIACASVIYALIARNFLVLLHNALIVAMVLLVFNRPIGVEIVLVLPALFLTAVFAAWCGYVVATLCARFRDLVHAVQSLLQLAFYITPVIWKPEFLPEEARWLEVFNPFAILVGILRDPILGTAPSATYWLVAVAIAFGGLALSLPFIGRYRRRVLYWI